MRKSLVLIFLIISIASLAAFQWPIAGGFITASFGENDGDSFLKGIRISGYGSIVSPFLDGELIYYSNEANSIAPVMGNTKVLHHSNGFRSIYGHMEPFSDPLGKINLTEEDQLGLVGDSGKAFEKSLFFMIYDTKMDQYVNPQIILPPSGDKVAPRIESVILEINGSQIYLSDQNRIKSGRAKIYGRVVDSDGRIGRPIETVPYSITVFYLGNEINQIKFDILKEENDELILKGGNPVSFGSLYSSDVIFLGEISLSNGVGYLEIAASDISGNNSMKTYQLNID